MDLVVMNNISKRFPGTQALDDVNFVLKQGEILSLLGENGAGKTTLMKILFGMYKADRGEIFYQGEPVQIASPSTAIRMGICMVHQHFMLVPAFTVLENVIAGEEPRKGLFVDRRKALNQVREMIERYQFRLDPNRLVSDLSVGEQQRVELLKALYRRAKVLILDEPTAVLTPREVDELFVTLRMLRDQGTSIIIITHKLKETLSIADRVVVLRNGKLSGEREGLANVTTTELSEMMVGRPVDLNRRVPSQHIGELSVSLRNLNYTEQGVKKLKDISFDIREGEILGVAGVEGNGQTQLLAALTGLIKPDSMDLKLNGKPVTGDVRQFLELKIGHIPEDRTTMGLVLQDSIKNNLILGYQGDADISSHGLLKQTYINNYADTKIKTFDVKTPNREVTAAALSGGNQQKVVIARVLSRELDFLVVAHPTRGVDIGAIEFIHQEIRAFRDQGKAVLLVSADLDEVCNLSDRLVVLFEGEIVEECAPDEYSRTELGLFMTGAPVTRKGEQAHAVTVG